MAGARTAAHGDGRRIATTYNQKGRLALAQGATRWRKPPVSFGLRLRGPVDQGVIESALTGVARRHTALRTYFPEPGSTEHGVCADPGDIAWPLRTVDLRRVPAAERERREKVAFTELHETFAPQELPLFRGTLLRYETECVLALSIDHLVFDGASIPVFLADFERLYRSLSTAPDAPAADLGGSDFAEFSAYEQGWLASAQASASVAYWQDLWSGFGPFPAADLPTPRQPARDARGVRWQRKLARADVRGQQRRLCSGHLSLPALAAGAALAALRDLTGQRESGLLHPSSRRYFAGGDGMIGYLNNRVLLRVETPPGAGLAQIVSNTRAVLLDSMEHHMMPFELLLDRFAPDLRARRPDRPYLHLNVEARPRPPALPGLEVSFCWPPQDSTYRDIPWISIDLEEDDADLVLAAGYSAACFDDATVAGLMSRMSAHLTGRDLGRRN